MAFRIIGIVFATAVLLAAATAQAAWIVLPVDGYGCPPGYDLKAIRSDDAVVDVCVPDREALPSAGDEGQEAGDGQTARGPLGEDAPDAERM